MALVELPPPTPSPAAKRRRPSLRSRAGLVIFLLLISAGPLAFGAVDRVTQTALLALLAVGLLIHPVAVVPLSRWGQRLLLALLAIFVIKEFAPAVLFGGVQWREVLVQGFGLQLPWTHHPEPARAFDGFLVWSVAAVWFCWVRTLAIEREHRPALAWGLFLSAALVAVVSFSMRGGDPQAIYGLRYTPGWTGFGPFPNRNHTADFLAMGMAVGCGCVAWAVVRKTWFTAFAGLLLIGLIFAGILGTQSRGGLVAAAAGLGCFALLLLLKIRSKRALGMAVAGVLVVVTFALLSGAHVFTRFRSVEAGQVSTQMRLDIWRDAARMWGDAPLFGHGLGSFPQLFGVYQKLRLEDQIVTHPESSWLQWLTELGAVPILLAASALLLFCFTHLREAFARKRSFYLQAGAFSAVAILLLHSAIDVPAHRWGTFGFALAALAIACPLRSAARVPRFSRRAALVPIFAAACWLAPFLLDRPAWSPLTLTRLLAREESTKDVSLQQLQEAERHFPLSAALQQALGARQAAIVGRNAPAIWQRHFAIASTLVPGSWRVPAGQARAVARISPGLAIGYWQQAIERCDLHREETLRTAVRETATLPMAAPAWSRYVEANPSLLLAYAQLLPKEEARLQFDRWWKERAMSDHLEDREVEIFYENARDWATPEQFAEWRQRHSERREREFRRWAMLLVEWKDFEGAFRLLAGFIPEPKFPKTSQTASAEQLAANHRMAPKNVLNAQQLATVYDRDGRAAERDEVLRKVAEQEGAPPWFLQRAAYLHARSAEAAAGEVRAREFAQAVALLLRTK
jgi:O-antigen ligase